MKSIRAGLVLWLVGALLLGSVVVIVATYTFAHREIDRIFDEEMRQIAQAVHLREDWRETGNLRIARPEFVFAVRAYDEGGRVFFETILPSAQVDVPRTFRPGFTIVSTDSGDWRLYTHVTPEGIVQVGQPEARRSALARQLSFRMLLPMLLIIPFIAALLAWVLRRALSPLEETSRRVSDRDAARLDPLPTHNVPLELLPLVAEINRLLERVAGSMETQRQFFADAAHELRSPVAALSLQVQLAERAQQPAARAAAFEELKRGIGRARRLVEQLLDLARLDPAVRAEPRTAVDVARVARDVVGSYAAQAESIGVDLGAEAEHPALALAAEGELRSLIGNLIDNALRYSPRGSDVTVSVRREDSAVEIAVRDCGPGIPREEREAVFERFHRSRGDPTHGTGLGLPIVKAIVERHHGSIVLDEAHPDRKPPGLSVCVRLPAN